MLLCKKCGMEVNEDVKICPSCGNPMVDNDTQQPVQPAKDKNDFSGKIASLNDTADTTGDFDKADIEQNKFMGILAYLSWLVLVPIFAAPKSKFARFHANQGLVLAITEIAWWVASGILNVILYSINWRLGSIAGTLFGIANLVFLVLAVLGIVNAINGRAKELPVIGKFKILK